MADLSSVQEAANVIHAWLPEEATLLEDPVWHEETKSWHARIAIAEGPLTVVSSLRSPQDYEADPATKLVVPTHPMQPIVTADDGVVRFKENKIVTWLLEEGPFDMNMIACMSFSEEDRTQFAQLIGYSTSGFGDLSYATPAIVKEADIRSAALWKKQNEGG